MRIHRPIVLGEEAKLGALGSDVRVAAAELHHFRKAEIEIAAWVKRENELRIGVVSLDDIVLLERQLAANLDEVVAVPMQIGEAQIIAEGEALLLNSLKARIGADRDDAIVDKTEA